MRSRGSCRRWGRPGCLAVAIGLAWLAGARIGGLVMGAAILVAPVGLPARIGLSLASALGGEILEHEARARRELRARSFTDRLTGLRNYDFFSEAMAAELARVRRYGGCTTLVLIDLDRFKAYNDRHGHGAGNRLLAVGRPGAPAREARRRHRRPLRRRGVRGARPGPGNRRRRPGRPPAPRHRRGPGRPARPPLRARHRHGVGRRRHLPARRPRRRRAVRDRRPRAVRGQAPRPRPRRHRRRDRLRRPPTGPFRADRRARRRTGRSGADGGTPRP